MKKIIINSLILIIIGTCIYGIINLYLKKDKVCNINIYKINSGSMLPELEIGDIIITQKKKEYWEGDIITYRIENYSITHRIIKKEKYYYITKGDNNNVHDEEKIKTEQIQGKMILHLKIKEVKIIKVIIIVFIILCIIILILK